MPRIRLTDRGVSTSGLEAGDYWDTVQPHFGLRVLQSGKKRWMILYKRSRRAIGGYPTWSLKEARERAQKMLRAAEAGEDPFAVRESMTFGELAERFMRGYARQEHSKKWLEFQESALRRILLPRFGDGAAEVARGDVAAMLDDVGATAPAAANRIHSMLSKMYSWATVRELVEQHPLLGLPKPFREKARERVLTEAEIRKLVLALRSMKSLTAAVLELQFLTAQRSGEVRSIRWDEIDSEHWWTIPKTKSGRSHRVYLSTQARDVLARQQRWNDWVFPASRGAEGPATNSSNAVAKIRRLVEIPDWRPHDLRRTAATLMASIGVSPFVVERILGHSDRRRTTAIYDRWSYDSEIRHGLILLGRRIEEIVSGSQLGEVVRL